MVRKTIIKVGVVEITALVKTGFQLSRNLEWVEIPLNHAEGYNRTMERLINQRLGKNVFKETKEYARVQRARRDEEQN